MIRTERFFPPPSVILDAAYNAAAAPPTFPALPPVAERRVQAREGIEIFKAELKKHGIDVDELTEKFSWNGNGRVKPIQREVRLPYREPGEDDE